MKYRDGEPCKHRGCLNHVTHSCEGCGRIAGKTTEVYMQSQASLLEQMSDLCTVGLDLGLYDAVDWVRSRFINKG